LYVFTKSFLFVTARQHQFVFGRTEGTACFRFGKCFCTRTAGWEAKSHFGTLFCLVKAQTSGQTTSATHPTESASRHDA
jgi:hypothetical protein